MSDEPAPADPLDVLNQSLPLSGGNALAGDAGMMDALGAQAGTQDNVALDALNRLGSALRDADWMEHARLAQAHRPELLTHDVRGFRLDEVRFHPSYHALMTLAVQHGLGAVPWRSDAPAHAHLHRAAGFLLFTQLDAAVLCPVSMTYAVAPALSGNQDLARLCLPGLTAAVYDPAPRPLGDKPGLTMGMGMTEKQGGSDVRANISRADPDGADAWGERYRLNGHKWFFSAPMSDAFLVLAQTAQGPTCLLLPRILPDGRRNAVRIQRLKDKLGNHANASAEVEFHNALAWRVGPEGKGITQILEMGTLTRLDCALGSAGLMRQALSLAWHHVAQRRAFGRVLLDHPLMRVVLADLALESEAATALSLRLAHCLDQPDDPAEQALRRILTPVTKYWVCKRGSLFAQEAMECLGGNGYVEAAGEGIMARIYREMPLNSIWEGAGNIMALDLLRAVASQQGAVSPVDALEQLWQRAAGAHGDLDTARARLMGQMRTLQTDASARTEAPLLARRLAHDIAVVTQATLLWTQAPTYVASAFTLARLGPQAEASAFGHLPPGLDLNQIVARACPDAPPFRVAVPIGNGSTTPH